MEGKINPSQNESESGNGNEANTLLLLDVSDCEPRIEGMLELFMWSMSIILFFRSFIKLRHFKTTASDAEVL